MQYSESLSKGNLSPNLVGYEHLTTSTLTVTECFTIYIIYTNMRIPMPWDTMHTSCYLSSTTLNNDQIINTNRFAVNSTKLENNPALGGVW